LVLALNMMDEAHARGVQVNAGRLSDLLGIAVVPTIATRGQGVREVERAISAAQIPAYATAYPEPVERALNQICPGLPQAQISCRSLALLWLAGDAGAEGWLKERMTAGEYAQIETVRTQAQQAAGQPLATAIQAAREAQVEHIAAQVVEGQSGRREPLAQRLSRYSTHPLWGLPILALVLLGMYWFVGVFGAGTLVGLLEEDLFGTVVNPWVTGQIERLISIPLVSDFLVGEYGIWTMGMTYAVALLLPIVTTFFITFGILEDSGYLPRLAVLSNRMFRVLGLNGRAVLPMVLGLGCVTMATMTTRILSSKRDRLLVILLLALAIPCSAQLGVVLGMLAGISLSATLIWGAVVMGVLLAVGWLASRVMPGEREALVVELPPLRLPVLSNVALKTLARLEWYVKEALPLFLIGTVLLFTLDQLHVLPWLIRAAEPLVTGWLGLPAEASAALLLGFLRRDFAATGLFVMQSQGLLTNVQVVVAIVTITLFIPCVASTFMIAKERGARTAVAMFVTILPFAFLVGGLLNRLLTSIRWGG
ncbi:MAG TPA: ferrous iron transporter B, partial [Anaerolineaceae bacterium]|nr:ferrous iron transporter B [Anaerolineaceae bacterium]